MAKKFKKILAATAIAGAIAAAVTALINRYSKKQSQKPSEEEEKTPSTEDNLNTLDFASINNDTPREYVSISINPHQEADTQTQSAQKQA